MISETRSIVEFYTTSINHIPKNTSETRTLGNLVDEYANLTFHAPHNPIPTTRPQILRSICQITPLWGQTISIIRDYLPNPFEVVCRGIRNTSTWFTMHQTLDSVTESNTDLYSLEALRQEKIDHYEFVNHCLMQMIIKQWGINPIIMQVFDEHGHPNPITVSLLERCLQHSYEPIVSIDLFLEELKKFPPSQHQFFLVPDRDSRNSIEGVIRTTPVMHFDQLWVNTIEGQKTFLMIAPLGMYQALYNVLYDSQAVELLPAIGPMPVSELRANCINGTRVVGLYHCILDNLNIIFPDQADGYDARLIHFYHHDIRFHALVASSIPHEIRQKFLFYSKAIRNLVTDNNKTGLQGTFFRNVAHDLIDMNHDSFLKFYRKRDPEFTTEQHIFWRELARTILSNGDRDMRFELYFRKNPFLSLEYQRILTLLSECLQKLVTAGEENLIRETLEIAIKSDPRLENILKYLFPRLKAPIKIPNEIPPPAPPPPPENPILVHRPPRPRTPEPLLRAESPPTIPFEPFVLPFQAVTESSSEFVQKDKRLCFQITQQIKKFGQSVKSKLSIRDLRQKINGRVVPAIQSTCNRISSFINRLVPTFDIFNTSKGALYSILLSTSAVA